MYSFLNLDNATRGLMVVEINNAIETNNVYKSPRLRTGKQNEWENLLLNAFESHDVSWLSNEIVLRNLLNEFEFAERNGREQRRKMASNASELLASGQFNLYYMMAICKRAIREGIASVTVYRAKNSENPRTESQALVGTAKNPTELYEELCNLVDGGFASRLAQPNSGLSVRL